MKSTFAFQLKSPLINLLKFWLSNFEFLRMHFYISGLIHFGIFVYQVGTWKFAHLPSTNFLPNLKFRRAFQSFYVQEMVYDWCEIGNSSYTCNIRNEHHYVLHEMWCSKIFDVNSSCKKISDIRIYHVNRIPFDTEFFVAFKTNQGFWSRALEWI